MKSHKRPTAPTLEVVAAHAGVSRATASRVLAGTGKFSDSARDAVMAAAEQLGYSPNLAARSLVTKRSGAVAFVVAEDERTFFADPYFPLLLQGAQEVIAERELQLMFMVVRDESSHRRLVNYAAGGHLDGVMLVSLHGEDSLPRELESHGTPVVLAGRPIQDAGSWSYVDADNVGGAQAAVQMLIASRRRRIATITGPLDMSAGQDRLTGYRQALRAAGLEFDDNLVIPGDFTMVSGESAMAELLSVQPPIDAVFAASDQMAIGAMAAIAGAGLTVGADIAVVGFDDLPMAAQARPALTTVRQPIVQLGQALARCLVDRLSGAGRAEPTILGTEFIRRSSS